MAGIIKPNLEGVKLVEGQRYMMNVKQAGKKGCPVFPYSQERMDRNPDLREFFPKFKEKKSPAQPAEVVGGGIEEPVVIAEVVVDAETGEAEVEAEPSTESPVDLPLSEQSEPEQAAPEPEEQSQPAALRNAIAARSNARKRR